MCGVFGFISRDGLGPDLDAMHAIAINTQQRGRHAHGVAWIDDAGRLRSYKAPGRISDNIDELLHAVRDARMLIGHCRYSTSGPAIDNVNNHPHPCDGGWIVHNGTIYNSEKLIDRFGLLPSTDCDSEVLGLMIEERRKGSLVDRTAAVLNRCEGPAVVLGLWNRPAKMIVARRGKPLHLDGDENGNVYFASLPERLTDPSRVLDNTARVLSVHDGEIHQTVSHKVQPCQKRNAERNPPLGRPLRISRNDQPRVPK